MSHKAILWAIEQRGLKPTTKIILWHLCDRFNPDYGCFPSQQRLALDCEISRSTLNEHLDRLEASGLLRRVPRIDPATKRQMATRYILAFEEGFTSGGPASPSTTRNGETSTDGGSGHTTESPSQPDAPAEPCPETTHGDPTGAVSGFCPDPCPENTQSRVRNPDTNLVREPIREPVKEEEDAQAREIAFDRFFAELLRALGFEPDATLPAWWQGWPARMHVRRWVEDLSLNEDRIIEVATATRSDHPTPPDGPKALDRAMERASRQDAQTDAGAGHPQKPVRRGKPDLTPNTQHGQPCRLLRRPGQLRTLPAAQRDHQHDARRHAGPRAGHLGSASSAGCEMTHHVRFPKGAGRTKRALGVQQVLEWAFRVEKAQLELPPPKDVSEETFGFGLEYVLMQRAALGCRIDGGRHKMGSYTHPDAEVIAATVAGMPDSLGDKRMAIRVAELARAGLTPDWMPGAVPRCVPVAVKRNQHGERATTTVVGTGRVLTRGKWRTVEVLACPVTWRPHPEQIASARRGYHDWWQALDWVREGLIAGRMLRGMEVAEAMPKGHPWKH